VFDEQQFLDAVAPGAAGAVDRELGEEAVVGVVLAAIAAVVAGVLQGLAEVVEAKVAGGAGVADAQVEAGAARRRGARGMEAVARASLAANDPTPRVAPKRRRDASQRRALARSTAPPIAAPP
jgi:hypothetical protein